MVLKDLALACMDSAQNTARPPLPEHFAPMADRYFVVSDGNLYELDPTEDSQVILSVNLEPTLYAIECGKAQPLSSTHEVGTQEAGVQAEVEAKADAVTSTDACLPKKRKVSEAELEEQ